MWSKWEYPTTVAHQNSDGIEILTDDQVCSWRERGFALVDGLLPSDICNQVYQEAYQKMSKMPQFKDFGSNGMLEYPCGLDACDQITLHPNILKAAAQLLNTKVKDLRLVQSDIWMKYGKETSTNDPLDNNNQRVHCGLFAC
jgi:hypothetical protein